MTPGARCFFAGRPGAGPCAGRLERAHWIRQQVLRRELGGAEGHVGCPKCGAAAGEPCVDVRSGAWIGGTHRVRNLEMQAVVWDPRCWSWMCHEHHGRLDHARSLRVARVELPSGVEEYARERDEGLCGEPLQVWLDREYGERSEAA